MDSKVIIGLFVILIGLSIIINHVFKIDFPLFRIAFAIFIIFIGVKILAGSFGKKNNVGPGKDSVLSNQQVQPRSIGRDEEFNAIFGSTLIDLRSAKFEAPESDIELNAVFGEVRIFLPADARVRIKSSSVFGSVKTPDGRETSFGDDKTEVGDQNASQRLNLEANAVFGSVKIYNR
jgi:predicted membrane protein